ncbi:hypothetical protein K1719_035538 [Acacia pycnantha]|nr:hypothetical protein K1719_035538 [Acacia pycnantha]
MIISSIRATVDSAKAASLTNRGTFLVKFSEMLIPGSSLNLAVKVNGLMCKDAAKVNASDFFSNILAKPGATNNTFGSLVTRANVEKIPGLNTLDVSLSRIDYAPGGINPPHTHPRATELPGTQSIAATLFVATPPVPENVLAQAFQVSTKEVEKIKAGLAPKKH